jgi:hypothetical protein
VPEREALIGLFRQIKGYRVEIVTNTETMKGKVMGTEEPVRVIREGVQTRENAEGKAYVVLFCEDEGAIKSVDVEKIVSYKILDSEASEDLNYFLEAVTSERKKNMRCVTIFLDGGVKEIVVSYIAQMPSWRVSYRLVYNNKKAFIMGWGIIDNMLDEDLKDTMVSLIAGKPISFIYDIYTPPSVFRPVIKEEARTVSAPIELESQMEKLQEEETIAEAPPEYAADMGGAAEAPAVMREMRASAPAMSRAAARQPLYQQVRMESMRDSPLVQTKTTEMGEFFRYDILPQITVKRRQSAMGPIIQADIECPKSMYTTEKRTRKIPW